MAEFPDPKESVLQPIATPQDMLDRLAVQLNSIWQDLEVLVWKITKTEQNKVPTLIPHRITNRLDSPFSQERLDEISRSLACSLKVNPITKTTLYLNPSTHCSLAVQINLACLVDKDHKEAKLDHVDNSAVAATVIEETYLISLVANGGVAGEVDKKQLGLIQLCMQQLGDCNHVYEQSLQHEILLKKFRHDFRTPLTSVSMVGGLLDEEDSEDLTQMGSILLTAADKMNGLLKDFKLTGNG